MAFLISLFQKAFSKAANFLFGKTKLFIIILGWFLVITGVLFLLRPEKARKKILSQSFGIFKGYVLLIAVYLVMLLISFGLRTTGIVPLLAVVAGVIVIIKASFSLKRRTYNKLAEYIARMSVLYVKIFACIQIAVGALMLLLQKRIW